MSLPAFAAVETFPVTVREDGVVVVEVPDARRARSVRARPSRAGGCRRARSRFAGDAALASRSRRRPAASSSLSRRRRPASRCSRSAARAATRRSGSPPGARILGGRLVSLEQDPSKCEAWRRNVAGRRPRGMGGARRGRRPRDSRGDGGHLRSRLPRRREGRLRGALRPRPAVARARRHRARRQRPVARGDARAVLGCRQADSSLSSVTVPLDRVSSCPWFSARL